MVRGTSAPSRYTGFFEARDTPRIANSGALMIGVKAVPPIPPRLETVKQPPCISAALSFPARAFSDSAGERTGQLVDVLLVRVADHRHQQSIGRVGRKAQVQVLLERPDSRRVASSEALKLRELLQRAHHGAQHERQRRELHADRGGPLLELDARVLQLGDVGFIELRNVRQIDPAGVQPRAGNALDAAERLNLHRTELREIGHLARVADRSRPGACRARTAGQRTLDVSLDVTLDNAALATRAAHAREIDAQLACEAPHARTRMGLCKSALVDGTRRGSVAPRASPPVRCWPQALRRRRSRRACRARRLGVASRRRPGRSSALGFQHRDRRAFGNHSAVLHQQSRR